MFRLVFTLIIFSFLIHKQAYAEDVQMISDRVPGADEMADILFPAAAKPSARPGVKSRSISFKKSPSATTSKASGGQKTSTKLGLPIKFSFNSAELSKDSKPYLDEIGKMMSMESISEEKLLIEGHTDAIGATSYNYELSKRRANAVKNYLINNYPIAPDRLLVKGMGENSPLQGTSAYDAVNRRVQFSRVNP